MGEALAFIALVFYSVNIILTKVASRRIDIDLGYEFSNTVIVATAAIVVLLQAAWTGAFPTWDWDAALAFALAGIFTTFLGRWLSFESIMLFGPARSSLFQLIVPLFTAIIAAIVLGERLSTLTLWGIPITLGGLFLTVYVPGTFARAMVRTAAGADRPALLRLIGASSVVLGSGFALCYSIGNILRGAGMRTWNEPVLGGLLGAISGLLLYKLVTPRRGSLRARLAAADRIGVRIFALMGTLNMGAQVLGIMAMHYIPVSVTSLIVSCMPVLVIPMSVFFLKNQEGITRRTVIGTAVTIAGIAMILLGRP